MNPRINTALDFVKSHPLYAALGALAIALLLFAAMNGIGKTIDTIRANRFDKAQAAHEKEVAGLKAEREAAIKRADEAEAKARLKESEANELKDLIAAKGGQIAIAAQEMEKKLEEAKKDAGNCQTIVDVVARTNCVCGKLRAAGFSCE